MTDIASTPDGVHAMVPEDAMCAAARKLRAAYAITPGAPFVQREFGFYCLERWAEQGMPADVARAELFGYDPSGGRSIGGLDWCEAAFTPAFEEKVLEDRGKYELVQDFAGRHVLCFKGRRSGFMPEYVDHRSRTRKPGRSCANGGWTRQRRLASRRWTHAWPPSARPRRKAR